VKKRTQDTSPINKNFEESKNLELNKIKTTNVNILLNRVRLDKRKTLKKRIIFSFILISLVSSLAIYFIV
jgi:hypothetical protein